MTLQQIEKIKATISKLENLKTKPTPTDISRVDSSLENFFHELYKSPYLNISNYFAYDMEITKEQMLADIDDIAKQNYILTPGRIKWHACFRSKSRPNFRCIRVDF